MKVTEIVGSFQIKIFKNISEWRSSFNKDRSFLDSWESYSKIGRFWITGKATHCQN
jgi:hypothetical protein